MMPPAPDNGTPETPERPLDALDEAEIVARFARAPDDAVGLAAYGLHRRALVGFRSDFAQHHSRPPRDDEMAVFLIGETSEARIAAYRNAVLAMGAMAETKTGAASHRKGRTGVSASPVRKARWPWFGMWVDAPMAPSGEPGPLNWRGLFGRLLVLLLAIITTALLLRILVVKS